MGLRGNALENLDLNRDFTKCDSRDARAFARIFHWADPDIQIELNHVSDGADYQYTMTLLSSQWNKLGGELGNSFLVHNTFPLVAGALSVYGGKKAGPMTPLCEF